jgi:tRNA threonylcarbamoyladenosine biosynthesis protein TsaE
MTISRSAEETAALGESVARTLGTGAVLALTGDLGAGKTHFVKGVARGLGFAGEVTSPTFTLIHEYHGGRHPLFHADLYRIESADEAIRAGLDEYLAAAAVIAIEWAEKFPALIPDGARWFDFHLLEDGTRQITEK